MKKVIFTVNSGYEGKENFYDNFMAYLIRLLDEINAKTKFDFENIENNICKLIIGMIHLGSKLI